MATKVIVVDDHPLFRQALRLILAGVDPEITVMEADSFDTLKCAVARLPHADLVLLDLQIPGVMGLSALDFLHDAYPTLPVAVVSGLSQHDWMPPVQTLGAIGYIHKSTAPDDLRTALANLLAGKPWWGLPLDAGTQGLADPRLSRLSEPEMRVLRQLMQGRHNRQIAETIHVSEATVKVRVSAILHKLGVDSRTQAAVLAQRLLSVSSR